MKQAEGFVVKGKEDYVYRMIRSIYGLKQASADFNSCLNDAFMKLGFRRSKIDPCLYTKKNSAGKLIIVCVYVDDLLILSGDEKEIRKFKNDISLIFKITDLGDVTQLLGMAIRYDKKSRILELHQQPYVERILEMYEHETHVVSTPSEVDIYGKYVKDCFNNPKEGKYPYREGIGCLMYLANTTRPDISNAVRFLSSFVTNFTEFHVDAFKRILKYLSGTSNVGIRYVAGLNGLMALSAYSDASWADDYGTARSTTGLIILYNGSPVIWKSVLQGVIANSTLQSEYIALAECVIEVRYIRSILLELFEETESSEVNVTMSRKKDCAVKENIDAAVAIATNIFVDNQAAICVGNSNASSKRSRHINIKLHIVKESVINKEVTLTYIESAKNLADIFTKSLSRGPFVKLRDQILVRV